MGFTSAASTRKLYGPRAMQFPRVLVVLVPTLSRQKTNAMNRKIREARILKRAREIAASGRHIGWYYVEAELHTKMGEPLARQVLAKPEIRAELDRICMDARKLRAKRRSEQDQSKVAGSGDDLRVPKHRPMDADDQERLRDDGQD